MQTINVLPGEWLTSEQAAAALGKSQRTIQEMGQDGRLTTKPSPDRPRERLYAAGDIERIQAGGKPRQREPQAKSTALTHVPRRNHGERADMALIVGSLVANHKAELEMIAAQFADSLRAVTSLILDAHKAERDDARQRWELERQDRLERERRRRQAAQAKREQPKAKAKRAHA